MCLCVHRKKKVWCSTGRVNWVTSLEPASPEGWRVLSEVAPASYLIRVISQGVYGRWSRVSIPDMSGEGLSWDVDPTLIKHLMVFTDNSKMLTEGMKMGLPDPEKFKLSLRFEKSSRHSLNSLRTQWWGCVRLDFPHSVFSNYTWLWYAF